jgi:hypothetical protein
MIPISMKLIQRPPSAAEIYKQTQFGVAVGLTQTAKDGQAAVVSALRSNFTLRGSWFQQNMRHGIKIKPATKYDLQAEIRTAADWLEPHETGKDKTARGGNVAVPTDAVRRNKRLIIPRAQRPKGLGAKVFVLQSKHGPVLVQRITRGKNKGLRVLYGLERRVRIRKRSTFYEPIERTVKRNINRNVAAGITRAFATMRK